MAVVYNDMFSFFLLKEKQDMGVEVGGWVGGVYIRATSFWVIGGGGGGERYHKGK